MTFRVFLSPQARTDIDRNAAWWAEQHSIEQALQWSNAIYDQLETLAEFPESHGLSAESGEFPYEIRDKLLGLGSQPTYRAVFTIKDGTVYVLTIRRATQDVVHPRDCDSLQT